jgi:hypothetical protein
MRFHRHHPVRSLLFVASLAMAAPLGAQTHQLEITGLITPVRGALVGATLRGTTSFAMSGFSAVVTYNSTRMLYHASSTFASGVWDNSDFRSIDGSTPGTIVIAAVEDTGISGSGDASVPAGSAQVFVELNVTLGICSGLTTMGFGSGTNDNIISNTSAVGFDITGADLTPLTFTIVAGSTFVRGNANGSALDLTEAEPTAATVTIADGIFILQDLFAGGPAPPCLDAADANNDGRYNLVDAIVIFQFLFGNPAVLIPEPYLEIGSDTDGSLGCATPPATINCP